MAKTKRKVVSEDNVKSKKEKTSTDEVSKKTKQDVKESTTDGYTAGGLSGLFGKNSGNAVESIPVLLGETKIVPKQKETPVAKDNEREKQRENRKKVKKMTQEEKVRTIFVGNMPLSADEKSVKKLFAEFGKIESVRVRGLIPTKETLTKRIAHVTQEYHDKQSALMFYVKFVDESSVAKALEKLGRYYLVLLWFRNGEIIDGHRIRVDTTEKKGYDKDYTVFVGNLPFTATEEQISALFEKEVGPVAFSRLMKNQDTGKGRGIAFVAFKESSSVDIALNISGCEFEGRQLRITKMMKKKQLSKHLEVAKKQKKETALKENPNSKLNKYKFSTRKNKSENENQERTLKKTAKRAIAKKKAGGKKTLMK